MDQTENNSTSTDNAVAELFAMKQENVNDCGRCGTKKEQETSVFLSNLLHDGKLRNYLTNIMISMKMLVIVFIFSFWKFRICNLVGKNTLS